MGAQVTVSVSGKRIGPGEPVFFIAEIGASHAGKPELAARLIEEAALAGSDAVKLQTIDPEESYVPGTASYDIFKKLWLPEAAVAQLMQRAKRAGVLLFTTPGSPADLRRLLDVGMPLIKISSGLMTNLPLIARAASTGLPVLISSGMSYLDEVRAAVHAAESAGNRQLALMHCTSLYPAPAATLNLAAMTALQEAFPYPVGYSDHYDGVTACVAATALGARLLEKHFTLDRTAGGPDDHFSADPAQLREVIRAVRETERMPGHGRKEPHEAEHAGRERFRRCLVARRPIAAGEVLTEDMIAIKRQVEGHQGLPPAALLGVVGRRTSRAIHVNESLSAEAFEER